MGLRSAGKTSLVKHILEGKTWEEIKNLNPTKFIDTQSYKYRGMLDVTTFDAGGQKQFIYQYFTDKWSDKIFSEVGLFFFVIDSSDRETLEEAKDEYQKSVGKLNKQSPNVEIIILLSKFDINQVTAKEIQDKFGVSGAAIYPVSIPNKTARKVVCSILDRSFSEDMKNKAKKLQKILAKFNKKTSALCTILSNIQDGLEVASSVSKSFVNPKMLEYLSTKSLISPIEKTKSIFNKLKNGQLLAFDEADLILWHLGSEYIAVYTLNERLVLFSILKEANFKLESLRSDFRKQKEQILVYF